MYCVYVHIHTVMYSGLLQLQTLLHACAIVIGFKYAANGFWLCLV